MTKKAKIPDKYQVWIDVRKRYHLSHAHIQMARELGMNPTSIERKQNKETFNHLETKPHAWR